MAKQYTGHPDNPENSFNFYVNKKKKKKKTTTELQEDAISPNLKTRC